MGSSPTKKKTDLKPQTDASEEEQTDLGVTFSGSAEDGHHVSAQDERLCEVLGTKNPETAHGLIAPIVCARVRDAIYACHLRRERPL